MGFMDEWVGGGKTVSLKPKGAYVKGKVLGWDKVQQRDFVTKAPMTWDDGSPRMQLCVQLQTELSDDANDDGVRRLFLKVGDPVTGGVGCIVQALREAGVNDLIVGGELTVQHYDDGVPTQPGLNPPYLYKAKFTPPAPTQQLTEDPFDLGGEPAPIGGPDIEDPF